ncbi:hypothetical protein B0H11DRAFT_2242237 [Mycena galericulata]|nr:hypothetical protein B0H11DRAFT_2242237 [Mycena galericulata]
MILGRYDNTGHLIKEHDKLPCSSSSSTLSQHRDIADSGRTVKSPLGNTPLLLFASLRRPASPTHTITTATSPPRAMPPHLSTPLSDSPDSSDSESGIGDVALPPHARRSPHRIFSPPLKHKHQNPHEYRRARVRARAAPTDATMPTIQVDEVKAARVEALILGPTVDPARPVAPSLGSWPLSNAYPTSSPGPVPSAAPSDPAATSLGPPVAIIEPTLPVSAGTSSSPAKR